MLFGGCVLPVALTSTLGLHQDAPSSLRGPGTGVHRRAEAKDARLNRHFTYCPAPPPHATGPLRSASPRWPLTRPFLEAVGDSDSEFCAGPQGAGASTAERRRLERRRGCLYGPWIASQGSNTVIVTATATGSFEPTCSMNSTPPASVGPPCGTMLNTHTLGPWTFSLWSMVGPNPSTGGP